MNPQATTRVDLHCHSTASAHSRLGIQRSLGLPECATPPEEVYDLAKRRGMDFVTITDHDTIDGCLQLADRPDCFISEELTARFRGEPQAVHILCLGITPDDHDWLQANASDVEECAGYLRAHGIACALAHPFYDVAAPLTPRHRRRLAEIFDVWETRNGSRAAELNLPAAIHSETRGAAGIGGSDDHAGIDVGRTWTAAPGATTPQEFLAHVRAGRVEAQGDQGGAAKWAHAAVAIAVRTLAADGPPADAPPPDPARVFRIAQRVIAEAAAREGEVSADLEPADGVALLEAWLASVGFEVRGRDLLDRLQSDDFSHDEFYRRARRLHARRLEAASTAASSASDASGLAAAATGLFGAFLPAIPYAASAALVAREKARLAPRPQRPRVAVTADGIAAVHGVAHTIEQIRELGVPGYDVEVVGTDSRVDRRLPSVAEVEIPFYEGLTVGVPALPDLLEALTEGGFDLLHVTAPGPTGVMSTLLAGMCGVPLVGSYHTELARYVRSRSGDEAIEQLATAGLGAFYRAPAVVLSPSEASDASLGGLGVPSHAISRWERGVEALDFAAAPRDHADARRVGVLYVGRLSSEKGIDLLAQSFLLARAADPRLHLVIAGRGPDEARLQEALGDSATLLGWVDRADLPGVYASADVFLFCSETDTYGQVIVEAGAAGLPVVAIAEGGPATLVADRRTGLLCPPDPNVVANAVLELAASPLLRRHLGNEGRSAAKARTWPRAMAQLAEGYGRALAESGASGIEAGPGRPAAEEWHLGARSAA